LFRLKLDENNIQRGRSKAGAKIKKFRLPFFVALIMLPLLVVTGCQKKVTVKYGYKLSCLNCQKIIKSKTDSKSVLVGDARRWKIEKINVPCSKDQTCNQKRPCKNCQYQECQGRKSPLEEAKIGGLDKNLFPAPKKEAIQVAAPPPPAPAPPAPSQPPGEIIRVGLYEAGSGASISLLATGPFQIFEGDTFLAEGRPGEAVTVTFNGGIYRLTSYFSKDTPKYLRFIPSGQTIFEVKNIPTNNQFKGAVEIRYSTETNKLWAINELDVENYLKGIGEEPEQMAGTPPDKYQEFLKASVVAFRSYAIAVKQEGKRNKTEPFDILATASDQVYIGYKRELHGNNLKRAVEDTSGQVVKYQGKIAKTPYFGSCDGSTRPGGKPWLVPVSTPACVGRQLRGHGWGMCMHGARHLATTGYTFQQILAYYYVNTSIEPR